MQSRHSYFGRQAAGWFYLRFAVAVFQAPCGTAVFADDVRFGYGRGRDSENACGFGIDASDTRNRLVQ